VIISFAWTTKPLLEGRKTVTRRDWTIGYLRKWQRAWDRGDLVHDAYNKLPFRGGKCVGKIRLLCRPYLERLGDMPEEDLEAEGGLWDSLEEFIDLQGGDADAMFSVIRFRFIPIEKVNGQMDLGL